MRPRVHLFRVLPLLGAMCLALPALAAPGRYRLLTGPASGTYRIDPQHTEVLFTIGHVGIANFTGRFDSVRGTYTLDHRDPAQDRARIVIRAASIDTGYAPRDAILRSHLFFDTARGVIVGSALIERFATEPDSVPQYLDELRAATVLPPR